MIVFDLGGVLISANHTWRSALAAAGAGLPPGLDPEESVFALPEYLPYEAGRITEEEYLVALGRRSGHGDPGVVHGAILGEEFPGARELVAELKARGERTACLSNNNPLHWRRLLDGERYPAMALLDERVASFQLGYHKPEPEVYRAFEEKLGVSPGEIVFFEDNAPNAAAAREAGWDAVLLPPVEPPVSAMRAALRGRRML